MIDIITVVFRKELSFLACQAQSLDLYCRDIGLKKIYVMVNDTNLADDIDINWWGSLRSQVEIVPREHFPVHWSDNGWHTQQLLKILGASLSANTWSMILDAKTIMTRHLSLDLIFSSQGKANFGWSPIAEVFYPARDIANKIFQTDNQQVLAPSGVPFFFHNETVRSLIDFVATADNQDFCAWFLSNGTLTEFVLYSTWVSGNNERRNLYCNSDTHSTLDLCHVCHVFADKFDEILASHSDHSHTLSVHRRVWADLSEAQKQTFRNRLIAKGITRAVHL